MKFTNPWTIAFTLITVSVIMVGCRVELQHGLSEKQANEIMLILIQEHLNPVKTQDPGSADKWMITVPGDQSSLALGILVERALPRPTHPGFKELFEKDGFLPSDTQEQARYLTALTGELQKTLESDDSVMTARVHIHTEPRNKLIRDKKPARASASVYLKLIPGSISEDSLSDDDVRELISNSVANLNPEDVSVVRSRGRCLTQPSVPLGSEIKHMNASVPARDLSNLQSAILLSLVLMGIVVIIVAVVRLRYRRRNNEERTACEIAAASSAM